MKKTVRQRWALQGQGQGLMVHDPRLALRAALPPIRLGACRYPGVFGRAQDAGKLL